MGAGPIRAFAGYQGPSRRSPRGGAVRKTPRRAVGCVVDFDPQRDKAVPHRVRILEPTLLTGCIPEVEGELDERPHDARRVARPERGQLTELAHHGPQAGAA